MRTTEQPKLINVGLPTACCLPGYEAQLHQSGVQHSLNKLLEAKASFENDYGSSVPCLVRPCKREEETLSYRCNCTFQLILSTDNKFEYAMRTERSAVPLKCSYFPNASKRIQLTMNSLLEALNSSTSIDENCDTLDATDVKDAAAFHFPILREHLTSISFTSSWDEKECLVTLHYAPPGLPSPSVSHIADDCDEQQWLMQAEQIRLRCNATHLSGRSRGIHLTVPRMSKIGGCMLGTCETIFVHDEIHLAPSDQQLIDTPSFTVTYHKPDGAFQHPNPNVMYQALHWLFSCMHQIRQEKQGPISLLEMYCGYGAHTIPLCKSNLCDKIVTVEMDERLVQACRENCELNKCSNVVTAIKGDAGGISRNILHARRNERPRERNDVGPVSSDRRFGTRDSSTPDLQFILNDLSFDALLVDPPRQGLDSTVCELANSVGSFRHVLYISCGRHALLRDLKLLSKTFDVKSVVMLDLFPRTNSVETLVHLQRRCGINSDTKNEHW